MSEQIDSHLSPSELSEHNRILAESDKLEPVNLDNPAHEKIDENEISPESVKAFITEKVALSRESAVRALALMFSRDDWLFDDSPTSRKVLGSPETIKGLIVALDEIDPELFGRDEKGHYSLDTNRPEFSSAVSICSALGVEDIEITLNELAFYSKKTKDQLTKYEISLSSEDLKGVLKNYEKIPDELSSVEVAEQMEFRSKYLRIFLNLYGLKEGNLVTLLANASDPAVNQDIKKLKRDTDYDDLEPLNEAIRGSHLPPEEGQIVLAGLLFSPTLSTKDFVDYLENIQTSAYSDEMFDNFPDQISNTVSTRADALKIAIIKSIADGSIDSWKDKKILEIGGSTASSQLALLGAEPMSAADPGHDYKSMNMVHDSDQLLTLENYRQKYGQPHQADMICSAQLFDNGSGIEQTIGGKFGDWEDAYAAFDHVLLTMNNLLKEKNGYMIHDLPPRPETLKQLGIEEVAKLHFDIPGSNNVVILRSTGRIGTEPIAIKDRVASLNPEDNTWNLTK